MFRPVKHEDPLSDSAVGSSVGSASPFEASNANSTSPFNITELEGATGGSGRFEDVWSVPKETKEAERFRFYSNEPQQPHTDSFYHEVGI